MLNLKLKEFSTIIIVNKHRQTRSLRIATNHIYRFKYYLAALGLVFCTLIASVVYLNAKSAEKEQQNRKLASQIALLKGRPVTTPAATLSSGTYIQAIEKKLQTISDYLKRRGIKGFAAGHMGGNGGKSDEKKLTDSEVFALYNESLNQLVTAMAFTPLGKPRESSFSSFFGYRSDPFHSARAEFHPGLDFQGKKGDAVRCTANGTIAFAGWMGGYGNCVRITHINGIETLYGHLSRIFVKAGQKVKLGDTIAAVGSTGHSTGSHLHYEVRVNGKPVNPRSFLTLNN
jgi:murein DD-endopeptidase MepM/ murein hydrolase activator NlpD